MTACPNDYTMELQSKEKIMESRFVPLEIRNALFHEEPWRSHLGMPSFGHAVIWACRHLDMPSFRHAVIWTMPGVDFENESGEGASPPPAARLTSSLIFPDYCTDTVLPY
jgi:hypothetical protein